MCIRDRNRMGLTINPLSLKIIIPIQTDPIYFAIIEIIKAACRLQEVSRGFFLKHHITNPIPQKDHLNSMTCLPLVRTPNSVCPDSDGCKIRSHHATSCHLIFYFFYYGNYFITRLSLSIPYWFYSLIVSLSLSVNSWLIFCVFSCGIGSVNLQ